jgi:mono/diheme cytochrome c family protein
MFLASKKLLFSRQLLASFSNSGFSKVCVVSFSFAMAACGGGEVSKPAGSATSSTNTAVNAVLSPTTAAVANTAPIASNASASQVSSTDIASAVSLVADDEVSAVPVALSQVSTSVAGAAIEVTKQAAEAAIASFAAAPTLDDTQAQTAALTLWRNNDLSKHPKGSCAGCHGADFFDLARIGSTDLDVVRRAVTDGATQAEAQALLHSIKKMRAKFNMPVTDARNFRPFQPGGLLLPAPATDLPHIANVKRDIAFGKQLEAYLPTMMGARIDSLDKAKKARDELLDIAQGTNNAGANPKKITLRSLPIGLQYPLWSADLHHGKAEGTFNDWIADIAHDPKPEQRAQWQALQDAYLAMPSNENFWKMYNASKTMTQTPLLGSCSIAGAITQSQCTASGDFNKNKFLSSLMGQHMLRLESTGKSIDDFYKGAVSLSYLDNDASFKSFMTSREGYPLLPNNPWEVADRGRVMLETNNTAGSFQANLRSLGYPEFAVQSIDPNRSGEQEKNDLFKAWFWIGFTIDPSFARIHKSNATKVGEYMVGNLMQERFFNHNMFSGLMRLAVVGTVQDANVVGKTRPNRVEPVAPVFLMNYSYLWGYNRTVLDTQWNDPKGSPIPSAVKAEMESYWGRLTGNGFRMSLYLQMDELEKNRLSADQKTQLVGWIADSINPYNGQLRRNGLWAMYQHFNRYHGASLAADVVLLERLKTLTGVTEAQW